MFFLNKDVFGEEKGLISYISDVRQ